MKHKYKKEIFVVPSPQVRREWKEGEDCPFNERESVWNGVECRSRSGGGKESRKIENFLRIRMKRE